VKWDTLHCSDDVCAFTREKDNMTSTVDRPAKPETFLPTLSETRQSRDICGISENLLTKLKKAVLVF
jgi:hypothetical protein